MPRGQIEGDAEQFVVRDSGKFIWHSQPVTKE